SASMMPTPVRCEPGSMPRMRVMRGSLLARTGAAAMVVPPRADQAWTAIGRVPATLPERKHAGPEALAMGGRAESGEMRILPRKFPAISGLPLLGAPSLLASPARRHRGGGPSQPMDIKETEILGADAGSHWYYRSKAEALEECLDGIVFRNVLDVGA